MVYATRFAGYFLPAPFWLRLNGCHIPLLYCAAAAASSACLGRFLLRVRLHGYPATARIFCLRPTFGSF